VVAIAGDDVERPRWQRQRDPCGRSPQELTRQAGARSPDRHSATRLISPSSPCRRPATPFSARHDRDLAALDKATTRVVRGCRCRRLFNEATSPPSMRRRRGEITAEAVTVKAYERNDVVITRRAEGAKVSRSRAEARPEPNVSRGVVVSF